MLQFCIISEPHYTHLTIRATYTGLSWLFRRIDMGKGFALSGEESCRYKTPIKVIAFLKGV
jgi:hypothetical protein